MRDGLPQAMLTIRREQMEVLSAYMRQSFEDRMVRHFAAAFPVGFKKLKAEGAEETAVRRFIQSGILKAGHYGIRAERDVASYLEFMLLYGADFEHGEGMNMVLGYLKDDKLPGHAKMTIVREILARQPDGSSQGGRRF